ncbi:hypothetical protein [uncultured Paraglaciecola sp.]|uniref:hypothetical protein n=1 Tax=uncultured Paraglaciecola sp. TaxID=1765024 RepID=UPI00261988DA|nr:hypothetical protein [uncultured Paraglaciecola sp.]
MIKKLVMALFVVSALVGCSDSGNKEVTVDQARLITDTTLGGKPAVSMSLSEGSHDNYMSVTFAKRIVDVGKIKSEKREQTQLISMSVDWDGKHYVESSKHDTWSSVKVSKKPDGVEVSVSGRFVRAATDEYIDVSPSTLMIEGSDVELITN